MATSIFNKVKSDYQESKNITSTLVSTGQYFKNAKKNAKIYILMGINCKITTRNKMSLLKKVHEYYCEKDFINVMSGGANKIIAPNNKEGLSYSYNLGNNDTKDIIIQRGDFVILYKYYSNILGETAMDESGNVTFKVGEFISNNSISNVEAASDFISINTLFNFSSWHHDNDNMEERCKNILWIHNIHYNRWLKGMSTYSGHNTANNNENNKNFIMISGKRLDSTSYSKLHDINTLLSSNADSDFKKFLYSIIPIYEREKRFLFSDEKKVNYYMIDKNLSYYKTEEDNLNVDENKLGVSMIKPLGRFRDLKALEENKTKAAVENNKNMPYNEYKILMDKNLFNGNNFQTTCLTFRALHMGKGGNLLDFEKILQDIVDNKGDNKKTYTFDVGQVDSNFFLLFGYRNKMCLNSLPYDIYKKHVDNLNREKELEDEKNKYNFPHYTHKDENIILIQNSLLALPQLEPFQINQYGVSVSILLLKSSWGALLTLEYTPILNNISNNTPLRTVTNDIYLSLLIGYEIIKQVYFGINVTIMQPKYFLHKYFDNSFGLGISATLFPLVMTMTYNYDISHNTLALTFQVQLATKVYGEDDVLEDDNTLTYVEFL